MGFCGHQLGAVESRCTQPRRDIKQSPPLLRKTSTRLDKFKPHQCFSFTVKAGFEDIFILYLKE